MATATQPVYSVYTPNDAVRMHLRLAISHITEYLAKLPQPESSDDSFHLELLGTALTLLRKAEKGASL
jgi:hypothetical protein